MQLILAIASRELKALFVSPLAWSILAVIQLILGYLFLTQVDTYLVLQSRLANIDGAPGVTDLVVQPLYTSTGIILLLITPLLTMRLISEERRNKTLSLLLSAPVANYEIILGKFLGILAFLYISILLISCMPLSLLAGGELDGGKFCANIIAILLLLASYAAIGLYMSCVASHPTIAAVASFGILLLLWLFDLTAKSGSQGAEVLQYVSLLQHYQALQSGLIDSKDISYFILFTATFLLLSIRRLDNDRLQK